MRGGMIGVLRYSPIRNERCEHDFKVVINGFVHTRMIFPRGHNRRTYRISVS